LATGLPELSASARQAEAVLQGDAVHADAFGGQMAGMSLHEGEAIWPGVGAQLSAPLEVEAVELDPLADGPLELLEHPPSSAKTTHAATVPRRPRRRTIPRIEALVTLDPSFGRDRC
jgi:hypothetical protein